MKAECVGMVYVMVWIECVVGGLRLFIHGTRHEARRSRGVFHVNGINDFTVNVLFFAGHFQRGGV